MQRRDDDRGQRTVDEPIGAVELPVPERALAIGAHPDDIEFGCGSTLAKWATQGCEVSLFVCTDGSKGTWDPDADLAQLVARRQDEQRNAAAALGARGEVVFGGWVDGELEAGLEQRAVVASWIRRLRPVVVLGHDPWKRYRLHPDHRNAGMLAIDGVVAARDPHFFPEQNLQHHRPDLLLLFEAEAPDHVEIVDPDGSGKLAALEEHVSQFESTMNISGADTDGAELEVFRTTVRDELARHGALADVPAGEAFKLIDEL